MLHSEAKIRKKVHFIEVKDYIIVDGFFSSNNVDFSLIDIINSYLPRLLKALFLQF